MRCRPPPSLLSFPGNRRAPHPGSQGEPSCGPFPAPGAAGTVLPASLLGSEGSGSSAAFPARLPAGGCVSAACPRGDPKAIPLSGGFPWTVPMEGRGMASAPTAQVKETPAIKPHQQQSKGSSLSRNPPRSRLLEQRIPRLVLSPNARRKRALCVCRNRP